MRLCIFHPTILASALYVDDHCCTYQEAYIGSGEWWGWVSKISKIDLIGGDFGEAGAMYEYKYPVRTVKVDILRRCEWIPRYAKICRSTEAMIMRSIRANYSRRFPATRLFCCNKTPRDASA